MIYTNRKLIWLFLIFPIFIFSQEKFTLSGIVTDESSNETLIGANIIIPSLQTGTTSNEYGLNSIYYKFDPGEINPTTEDSGINPFKLTDKYAFENAVYIDAEHSLSNKLSISYGVRFSTFHRLGQDQLNVYENDNPVIFNEELQIYEKAEPIGTESFKRSDVIKSFTNLEPRFALAYQLNDYSSVKASYNRMSQYLHILSNTSSPTPLDD